MTKTFKIVIGALLIAWNAGCKSDPAAPPLTKNPREYSWSIDTLAHPGSVQTLMSSMWGSSRDNIYICGHNYRRPGHMYHWNGSSWTDVKLHVADGGTLSAVGTLSGIFGFSAQNIYAVGAKNLTSALLIHFNGTQWREIEVPGGPRLASVWGSSSGEVWLGGNNGFVARYHQGQFQRETLRYSFDTTRMERQVIWLAGGASVQHLVMGAFPDTLFSPFMYFYERNGNEWVLRDSSYEFARVFISPGGVVYRYGDGGIQKQIGERWTTVLQPLRAIGMAGSSDNNIFAVGFMYNPFTGRVFHFNGTDWYEFEQFRMYEVTFRAAWTDGTEVFIIGTTFGSIEKTIVLRGR